jgi:Protein of unknown function (DUF4232)
MNRSIAIKIAVPFAIPLIATLMSVAAKAGTIPSCASGSLSLSAQNAGAAAGSTYYDLSLRNITGDACALYGYPGVSFRKDGRQVGRAAARDRSRTPATVILLPGRAAVSQLQVANARNYSRADCGPVSVHRLRVYPPGFTASLHARFSVTACSRRVRQLSTGPETPGQHGTS